MSVNIPVSANFNDGEIKSQISQINGQIKQLGAAVAEVNKQKFEPISLRSKEDLKTFVSQTQQLLKVHTELQNKMKQTGQAGKMPLAADWSKMYPNVQERAKKLQEVLGFYGNHFEDIRPGGRGGRGGGGGRHPHRPDHKPPPNTTPRGIVTGTAEAGLQAMGPVGGVGAGALRTGMAAGVGAGLMGLAGGILALGVGKAIGGVVGKMGAAEDNAIAYDTLKRTLGDVNIAFNQLRTVVKGTGEQYRVTYSEAARYATMYGRAGNLGAADFLANGGAGMAGEVGSGIGLSRSFGLDPAQGVGMLGMMRGLGVNRSETDTRRFAILIGETITKAGAFAKADEMMEAIASYAATQTRISLSENVAGYAGQLSGLASLRHTGLDVAGSAGLMSRVNASLSAGGAAGEASQFFTYGIGARHGLNPFELELFKSAGSAATLSSVFGEGSVASQFGFGQRDGNQTYLSMSLQELRERYGNDPGMLMHATARHLNISPAQAIAIHQMPHHRVGEVEDWLERSGWKMEDVNPEAISALSQVVSGSAEQRMAIATDLYSRSGDNALSKADRERLDDAMTVGDDQWQTAILTQLLAQYGQEDTQGKHIRDSKVALDNINTSLAEKLIPISEAMRDGILWMAGGRSKGPRAMQEELARITINERYDELIDDEWRKLRDLPDLEGDTPFERILSAFDPDSPRAVEREEIRRRVRELEAKRQEELAGPKPDDMETRRGPDRWIATEAPGGEDNFVPYRPGMAPTHGLNADPRASDALFSALIQQESGGQHYARGGGLLTSSAGARGITQVMPATGADPGFGVRPLQNDSEEEYLRFGRDYLDALLRYYNGDEQKALAAYNAGPGAVDNAVRGHGSNWLASMSEETRGYVPSIRQRAAAYDTPAPATGASGDAGGFNVTADPLRVDVHVTGPGVASAPQNLQTQVGRARPTGAGAY